MFKKLSQKKKRTSLFALLAVMMLLFTGCVRSGVGVIIHEDDTGTVEISMGINVKYYDMFGGEIFGDKTTTTLTDGDDTYICCVEHKEFKDLEELKTILLEVRYDSVIPDMTAEENNEAVDVEDYDDLWPEEDESADSEDDGTASETEGSEEQDLRIFKDADITHTSNFIGDKYRFAVTTNPQKQEAVDEDSELDASSSDALDMDIAAEGIFDLGFELPDMDSGDMFKLVVAVTMPGTITSETGTVNENTVTFTLNDIEQETVFVAESSTTNIAGIVGVAIAIVILIVVLAFVFGKKKPQNHTFD